MTSLIVIEESKQLFAKALSTTEVTWEKESQFALQSLQKNDYLAKVASNSKHTLQNAIINIAAIGISLNPVLKHAYLVPRDKQVVLDISYMGLLHLAIKSGSIVFGQAKLVYKADQYENCGIDRPPLHRSDTFGEKGPIVGCYCTVKLPSGDYLTEEMDIQELNKIRNASSTKAGGNNPWTKWPEEMMRKSVVKRAAKYWPVSERMAVATDYLNQVEGNAENIINEEPEPAVLPDYSEDDFHKNFPAWQKLVEDGKRTAEEIANMISSKYLLTENMVLDILSLGEAN